MQTLAEKTAKNLLGYFLPLPVHLSKARATVVMSVCLIALMIVLLIYCILYIFLILIDIILVMSDVDYLYSFYVATLCIERVT